MAKHCAGALDSRGNWLEKVLQLNAWERTEGRTVNGVNEYLEADLNTGASPPDPVALTHDANPGAPGQAGNLTYDPTAPNVGALDRRADTIAGLPSRGQLLDRGTGLLAGQAQLLDRRAGASCRIAAPHCLPAG